MRTRRKTEKAPVERGFSLVELTMVAAIILIIAALAIPSFVRARSTTGEASAVATMRVLFQAEARYSNLFDNSFSSDLRSLGAPAPGQGISPSAAELVDDVLAARLSTQPSEFVKGGYVFRYTPKGAFPAIGSYTLTADPTARGSTGIRSFFVDNSGVIRANSSAQATAGDPPMRN